MKVILSCPTLCNPMDYRVHEILQARILEWVSITFSRGSSQPRDGTQFSCIAGGFLTSWVKRKAQEYWSGSVQFSSVQSLSLVWLSATPWTAARQASLSITNAQSPPKPMSIERVMPSNHLSLYHPLLRLPSIFPSIRVFFQWVSSSHQLARELEFQLQHQSFQWTPRTDLL